MERAEAEETRGSTSSSARCSALGEVFSDFPGFLAFFLFPRFFREGLSLYFSGAARRRIESGLLPLVSFFSFFFSLFSTSLTPPLSPTSASLQKTNSFLCCSRNKIYWMTPEWGSRSSDLPPETQFVLAQLRSQLNSNSPPTFVCLVPLIERGAFRATLRPPSSSSSSDSAASTDDLCLRIESGSPWSRRPRSKTRCWSLRAPTPWPSPTPPSSPPPRSRAPRGPGPRRRSLTFVDLFGWCTWDAFYSSVSARGVADGLEPLREAGAPPPGFLIIDDGWQVTTPRRGPAAEGHHAATNPVEAARADAELGVLMQGAAARSGGGAESGLLGPMANAAAAEALVEKEVAEAAAAEGRGEEGEESKNIHHRAALAHLLPRLRPCSCCPDAERAPAPPSRARARPPRPRAGQGEGRARAGVDLRQARREGAGRVGGAPGVRCARRQRRPRGVEGEDGSAEQEEEDEKGKREKEKKKRRRRRRRTGRCGRRCSTFTPRRATTSAASRRSAPTRSSPAPGPARARRCAPDPPMGWLASSGTYGRGLACGGCWRGTRCTATGAASRLGGARAAGFFAAEAAEDAAEEAAAGGGDPGCSTALVWPVPTPGVLDVDPPYAWSPQCLSGVGLARDPAALFRGLHGYEERWTSVRIFFFFFPFSFSPPRSFLRPPARGATTKRTTNPPSFPLSSLSPPLPSNDYKTTTIIKSGTSRPPGSTASRSTPRPPWG